MGATHSKKNNNNNNIKNIFKASQDWVLEWNEYDKNKHVIINTYVTLDKIGGHTYKVFKPNFIINLINNKVIF